MKISFKTLFFLGFIALLWGCSKDATSTVTPTPTSVTKSTAKDITKFSFAALSPAVDATICLLYTSRCV